MYFNLNNVDIVKGKKRYLIIDPVNYQTIEIDKKLHDILILLNKGFKIKEITDNYEFLLDKLKELETLGVGYLSERYIKQTKFKVKDTIDMVWFNVTSQCNFRCVHCYENASMDKITDSVLTLKKYDQILNKLIKRFKSIKCVQITGGEPLLKGYDFIKSLIEIIKKYPIQMIEIYSNLSLLNDEYIELFKKYGVCVATSIYSQYESIHDEITKVPGSHNNLICAVEKLKKSNIKFRFGIIIMNKNLSEKDTLYKWVTNKFSGSITKHYDIVRPAGRGQDNALIDKDVFMAHYLNQIKSLKRYNYDSYFYNKKFNSCWGNKVCIKSDGTIYPCIMSSLNVGHVDNIISVLTNNNSYRYLTKDKIQGCSKCELRYLCNECRAIYSNDISEIYDKPFTCTYDPPKNIFK